LSIDMARISFKSVLAAFDLTRLRGALVVAAGALAIFIAMHFVLALSLGMDAATLYPSQRLLGLGLYEKIWGRVAAIDRLYNRRQLPRDTRLGVYIGVSTTAAGIQRRHLDERATAADRWIVLTGAGLSFENIENVMHPLFFCSLKPSVVVFGVHPQMLVGERYIGDEPAIGLQPVVGRRKRAHESLLARFPALGWLEQHWLVRHHALVEQFLRSRIYGPRLLIFHVAGVSAEWLCPPAVEPWDEDPLELWNLDDIQERFAHAQLEFWSKRGHFLEANYDAEGNQARALVRMIRAYRDLGADVYIVVMPLRSTVRSMVPRKAKPMLLEVIQNAIPEAPPPVIDLETAIPDRLFLDEAHLSKAGAERLSKMVAEFLQAKPGDRPAADGL
jgi:hypothetical protein